MNTRTWIYPEPADPQAIATLTAKLGIRPLTASILLHRGFAGETAEKYWNPQNLRLRDFRDLPNTVEAGEQLAAAIRNRKNIMICGDYDVDGITASALMAEFINLRGGKTTVMLPNRFEDGYGISDKFVAWAQEHQIELMITVDCGITAVKEIQAARDLGIDVIVTDHHEPAQMLPRANVIVDPKVTGPEEMKSLAGVGVVMMVVRATAVALGENDQEPLRRHLDLVALGTVADVVPLLQENRSLTRAGLAVINRGNRLGLRALAHAAGLTIGQISSIDLAYRLAPRINAAGRIGDARLSLDLLMAEDANLAEELAQQLNLRNVQRQQYEQRVLEEVGQKMQTWPKIPAAILVMDPKWPLGVIGLAASKVCEKYHRPCFVLTESQGKLKGSARSIPEFPLHTVLQELSEYLEKWGGHHMAAGLTLARERLGDFQNALQIVAEQRLNTEVTRPVLNIDARIQLQELNLPLVREFKRFEPIGFQNHRPLLAISDLQIAQPPRVVGERHLKLKVMDQNNASLDTIGFGLGDLAAQLQPRQRIALAGHAAENNWNNSVNLQFEIKDVQIMNRA